MCDADQRTRRTSGLKAASGRDPEAAAIVETAVDGDPAQTLTLNLMLNLWREFRAATEREVLPRSERRAELSGGIRRAEAGICALGAMLLAHSPELR